jgi:TPR repeat protein
VKKLFRCPACRKTVERDVPRNVVTRRSLCGVYGEVRDDAEGEDVSETVKRYWFPSETTGMLEVAFVLASDYDTILRSHQDLERRLKEAETRADALSETILWALGERDEFQSRPEDWNERKYKPWYWWRGELRKRFDTAMGKEPG